MPSTRSPWSPPIRDLVRTLVAHEPPSASVLPDATDALAACRAVHDTYQRHGWGAGMAHFIALVSLRGPVPADFASQPAPDPAMFGMPTEDDGTRDDLMLGSNIVTVTHYRPDVDTLRADVDADRARGRCRLGRRARPPRRRGRRRAARHEPGDVPGRPRRLPRRRVRPERASPTRSPPGCATSSATGS